MRNHFLGLSVILCLSLSGCATDTWRQPPMNQPHATIRGTDHPGILGSNLYSRTAGIASIDHHPVGTVWSFDSPIRITPGPHQIAAFFATRNGFTDKGKQITVELEINAKAGEDYLLNSSFSSQKATLWIVNRRGNIVSAKVTKSTLPFDTTEVTSVPEMAR